VELIRARALTASGLLAAAAALTACGGGATGTTAAATTAPAPVLSPAAAEGFDVVKDRGCVACHSSDGSDGVGPTWAGLAGSTVTLEDGRTVTADDPYLRRAILAPEVEITAGAKVAMPSYEGLVTDAEVDAVIAYLRELGTA
jgi:cytochrome c2